MSNLLQANSLSHRYGSRRGVDGFDLTLNQGDIVGLAGLNGAGKSTTLSLLAGVLCPGKGGVLVSGKDPATSTEARQSIGFAPDRPPLYPTLRVDEHLAFVASLHGMAARTAREAVDATLMRCDLKDVSRQVIRTLSGGYRQRVGLASALVHAPDILLLDEPTEGLDPNQTVRFRSLISDHANTGAALISSHRLEVIAGLCNRLLILHEGRLLLSRTLNGETADELLEHFTRTTGAEVH